MKKFSKKFKNKNFFSIITVVLNGEKHLEKCIQSVLNQSFKNFELIVIDGKSKDRSIKIIKKYKKEIAYWCSEKDNGIYDAMNKGIKKAKGNIIGILNSDDTYTKNALKIVNDYFSRNKKLDMVFGSVKKDRVMSGFHPNKIKWKFNIYPGHSSGFFTKRKNHIKFGLYNTKFKYSADYDLLYRFIVKHKLKGISTKISEVTGNFSLYGIGSRVNFFNRLLEEHKIRIHNKQNVFLVLFLFFLHFVNNLLVKFKLK